MPNPRYLIIHITLYFIYNTYNISIICELCWSWMFFVISFALAFWLSL